MPHPILIASWVGFFVTSLNLIPAGQLDGGHILYAASPRWHRRLTWVVPIVLLGMGVVLWTGWILWGVILLLPAMRHPHVPYFPLLPDKYRWLPLLALALLLLTFLPAPFAGVSGLDLFSLRTRPNGSSRHLSFIVVLQLQGQWRIGNRWRIPIRVG